MKKRKMMKREKKTGILKWTRLRSWRMRPSSVWAASCRPSRASVCRFPYRIEFRLPVFSMSFKDPNVDESKAIMGAKWWPEESLQPNASPQSFRFFAARVQQQLLKMAAAQSGLNGVAAGATGVNGAGFPYGPARMNYFGPPFPGSVNRVDVSNYASFFSYNGSQNNWYNGSDARFAAAAACQFSFICLF